MTKKKTAGAEFETLVELMRRLRGPDGCPWDKHQTHQSLLKHLFSEAQEVRQAVRKKDWDNLAEELGDILLQVVFHSQLAAEKKRFAAADVVRGISEKLIRRHPHVFGGKKVRTSAEVVKQWAEIKKQEKAGKKPLRRA